MKDPVDIGRDALNPWTGGYPWYDADSDGIRRVDVPQPSHSPGDGLAAFPASALQWTAWIVIALLLAGVVYLSVRALWLRERRAAEDEEEPVGGADRVESLPLPAGGRRLDLLAEARRCREQGDYGRAIVYLFSHQLLQLDKHSRIHLARGKTNRQYLREIRPWPSLGELVEQTTLAFEQVFFGHHPLDRPAFESCWSRLDEFERLVENG
jgi:hypothetical protein